MTSTTKCIIQFLLIQGLIIGLLSCQNETWNQENIQKNETGLKIKLKNVELKFEIITESIVRVIKAPKGLVDSLPLQLAVIKKPEIVKWKVKKKDNQILIITNKITAIVDENGVVSFTDIKGNTILNEENEGFIISDTSHYNIQQSFVCVDEGLYGLGQYQNGILNWKNTPLRLKQFNQEIAIPFLVSTNNYGILWNNYSVTDFNYPQNSLIIDSIIDRESKIKTGTFTPEKSGEYCFFIDAPNSNYRFKGPVLLTLDGDTVIHYNTIWVPESFSGKINLQAGHTYRVVFQNSNSDTTGEIRYNGPDFNRTTFSSNKGKAIDYYFIHGKTPAALVTGYRELTGQAPLFAKWAYGFWQCRERYSTQKDLLENAREYRKRKIPIDNIVQDWNYWPGGTWGPEWERSRYPDPKAMCKELEYTNIHLVVSVWPKITNEILEKRYSLKEGKLGGTGILDFFDTTISQRYYSMLKDSMFDMGVSAIWLDGTEPENYPGDAMTAMGTFEDRANVYSLLVTKAMYEGHRKDFSDKRVFNLTRSAFAGQQRYAAASWSGDVAASWEQFQEQIPAGLNFCMAGIPYWTTDIGGFFRDKNSFNPQFDDQYTNDEFIELLTRWFQYGTFTPLFRIHGYVSKTEIWRYGKEFETIARKYINIRYKLMPYIYSEAWKVTNDASIIMRPLVYDFPANNNTHEISDQFMFGSAMMICPVTTFQARTREVYLPEGLWYDFQTNAKLEGGKYHTISAPLDQIPIFIRAGAIIPMGPEIQFALQKTDEPIELYVYEGKDGSFTLYQDDGETYDYEQGEFSSIELKYLHKENKIVFEEDSGDFFDYETESLNFRIITVPGGVTIDVPYTGKRTVLGTK